MPPASTAISGGTIISTLPKTASTLTSVTPAPSTASRKSSEIPPKTPSAKLFRAGIQRPARVVPLRTLSRKPRGLTRSASTTTGGPPGADIRSVADYNDSKG